MVSLLGKDDGLGHTLKFLGKDDGLGHTLKFCLTMYYIKLRVKIHNYIFTEKTQTL